MSLRRLLTIWGSLFIIVSVPSIVRFISGGRIELMEGMSRVIDLIFY